MYVGELLHAEVPALSGASALFEIVAIARRPGVLSKVAVRPRRDLLVPRSVGIGADELARVSRQLDGERIEVVRWQTSASAYIADALGLGEVPPVLLQPAIRHARVLLGKIDVRGIAGWRGLNVVLASALTGWRIRLEPVSASFGWKRLERSMRAGQTVVASVLGSSERGVRVEIFSLYAILSGADDELRAGQEVEVRITRMDADEGRIFVSARPPRSRMQLQLPL